MELFDRIPSNFFSVLVSGNKEIYVEALLLLHQMFKFELNIKVEDYISALIAVLEDKVYVLEAEDEVPENNLTQNTKARMILNRFIKTGWIDKEFLDGSFVEIITPRNYAISVMKLLSELQENTQQEYNSLVFSTYSSLKQAKSEHELQMYEAVLSAKANTEQLEYELRTLYHGIRSFLNVIQEQNDVNFLLKNHFEEFKKMSDRIYHPIKTMDSIYRYAVPIQSLLSDVLDDENLMHNMCERAMTIKKYADDSEAEREIISSIDYVMDAYQSVRDIINEIDRKHSTYTKRSIEKIQYLMTADQTIKGKLVALLKTYAASEEAERIMLGEMLEKNIQVNRQEFFDGKSLYHKSVRTRRMDIPPLEIEQANSFSDVAMSSMLEQMKSGYPIARVRAYVENLFPAGSVSIQSKDIVIQSDSDFILLILAVVRSKDIDMGYTVQLEDGKVEHNGYHIPNMTIRRKEEQYVE